MTDQDSNDPRLGEGLTWVKGSPIAEGIVAVRSEMAAPCISVDTVNANWSDLVKHVANLQAKVTETCGTWHSGGLLFGKLTAYRKGQQKSVNFSIKYGPLAPGTAAVVATQLTLFFEDPQPDKLEMIVNGVCAQAKTISSNWEPCNVA